MLPITLFGGLSQEKMHLPALFHDSLVDKRRPGNQETLVEIEIIGLILRNPKLTFGQPVQIP